MVSINDIIKFTETFAPLSTQCEWDNSGLLVNAKRDIDKVLLCLDITKDVVAEAHNLGAQLIISHHPIIFSPLRSVNCDSVVSQLIKSDIYALCLHTNLDIAQHCGVNTELAKALDLKNTKLYQEDFLCVGELEKQMSCDEFARFVKESLNCRGLRYTKSGAIKTVAVSSGGGGDAVTLKDKYNFDALVTGEIKHHLFLLAQEMSLCAIEAGHFSTEDVVIEPLKKKLCEQFKDVEFLKSEALTDPVHFI